jgi:hypothetical protein
LPEPEPPRPVAPARPTPPHMASPPEPPPAPTPMPAEPVEPPVVVVRQEPAPTPAYWERRHLGRLRTGILR